MKIERKKNVTVRHNAKNLIENCNKDYKKFYKKI